jgi:hypothetical protein
VQKYSFAVAQLTGESSDFVPLHKDNHFEWKDLRQQLGRRFLADSGGLWHLKAYFGMFWPLFCVTVTGGTYNLF